MKTFLAWGLSLGFGLLGARAAVPELLWETHGLVAPESVVFDAERGEFFVSNMGSYGEGAVAGDGFISRVSADGRVLELRWAAGLDNPKGLALANGRLYVGDDRDLVEIDPASGRILARHAPDDGGPGDFNDCTADPEGNVYVCSGRLATVFRLHAGKFEPWCKLDPAVTGGINGLRAERDRLLLGGWSLKGADGREQVGHISTIAFRDRAVGRIGERPVGHVDGLEPDGQGGYTVTDWLTGEVLQVSAEGAVRLLLTLHQGTADHTYLPTRRLLVIPLMKDDALRAYRWAP